jgi:hypothetical protein
MERIGHDPTWGRDLYMVEAASAGTVPADLSLSSPRFVCLIAWDARSATVEEIALLAQRLLGAGAVYICAWGPDSRRVHDICDEEAVGPNPSPSVDRVVMTTWHSEEPLTEALLFVLISAWPDAPYEEGCAATLAIAIGSPVWAAEIRTAFADPRRFVAQQLAGH